MTRKLILATAVAVSIAALAIWRLKNPSLRDVLLMFESADEVELISIEPMSEKNVKNMYRLEDWEALGKTSLNKDTAGVLLKELKASVASSSDKVMKCFWPRHALRAKVGDKTAVVLICFQCDGAVAYVDERGSENVLVGFRPGATAAKVFNKVLSDAKVPMPKQDF